MITLDILINNTYHLNLLRKRVRLLKNYYSDQVFHSNTFQPQEYTQEDLDWLKSLDHSQFQIDQSNLTENFTKLESELNSINPLTIFVPIELPNSEIEKIDAWLRQNFNHPILFEIKFDYELIGGCKLVWNGHTRDYSIKQKLHENQDVILNSFGSYIK